MKSAPKLVQSRYSTVGPLGGHFHIWVTLLSQVSYPAEEGNPDVITNRLPYGPGNPNVTTLWPGTKLGLGYHSRDLSHIVYTRRINFGPFYSPIH
jgi:hypothetical protein